MTGSRSSGIERAIAWRSQTEVRMAEARELLESARDGMPISLERVQLDRALVELRGALTTCARSIEEGQRLLRGTDDPSGQTADAGCDRIVTPW